jgi:hypothetical protein
MPKGKPWTVEQERQLKVLFDSGKSIEDISHKLGKSKQSIRHKIQRLELKVEEGRGEKTGCPSSSNLVIPDDLPSIEKQLRVLAGAIDELQKDDLNKTDVMRLGRLIAGVKNYSELFPKYVDYRGIEQKVDYAIEWMKKRDEERKNLVWIKNNKT